MKNIANITGRLAQSAGRTLSKPISTTGYKPPTDFKKGETGSYIDVTLRIPTELATRINQDLQRIEKDSNCQYQSK